MAAQCKKPTESIAQTNVPSWSIRPYWSLGDTLIIRSLPARSVRRTGRMRELNYRGAQAMQSSFTALEFGSKKKVTRRERFLHAIEAS